MRTSSGQRRHGIALVPSAAAPASAVEAGRAWADRHAVCMRRFGCAPGGAWPGTLAEAEWLFLDSADADRRFCLAVVAMEAAAERWQEIVERLAA
jgi:hypothetical protein